MNPHNGYTLASMFKLERRLDRSRTRIEVIELGIKPQDFLSDSGVIEGNKRSIAEGLLEKQWIREAYLLWYPLIASCSFIRVDRYAPFAAEYIIPQLLMQWVRSVTAEPDIDLFTHLMGIRYFSCASERASDMGFNYVFPTSGRALHPTIPYCAVLAKSLKLTKPVYIHEYSSISECERALSSHQILDFIG